MMMQRIRRGALVSVTLLLSCSSPEGGQQGQPTRGGRLRRSGQPRARVARARPVLAVEGVSGSKPRPIGQRRSKCIRHRAARAPRARAAVQGRALRPRAPAAPPPQEVDPARAVRAAWRATGGSGGRGAGGSSSSAGRSAPDAGSSSRRGRRRCLFHVRTRAPRSGSPRPDRDTTSKATSRTGRSPSQRLDVIYPNAAGPKGTTTLPGVIMFHGGGWTDNKPAALKASMSSFFSRFLKHGFLVWRGVASPGRWQRADGAIAPAADRMRSRPPSGSGITWTTITSTRPDTS